MVASSKKGKLDFMSWITRDKIAKYEIVTQTKERELYVVVI